MEIGLLYKGRCFTASDDYEGAVTIQGVWVRYCIEYESQLAALMRHLDTVCMDKIDLHEVLRRRSPPYIISCPCLLTRYCNK